MDREVVALSPRDLAGHTVNVRPGTSDADVMWDTFAAAYHLPPPEAAPFRVIVDLGANIGLTAAHFAVLFPRARIVAVEMDPMLAAIAAEHCQPWADRITVISGAAWSHDGLVRYEIVKGEEFGAHITDEGEAEAVAYSLKTLFAEFDVVDYLKMDVEGAERLILTAAQPDHWPAKVRTIKVEVHGDFGVADCVHELERLGFSTKIDKRHWAAVVGAKHVG